MENCDLFATHFEGAHFDQVKDREKGQNQRRLATNG
jgi:hypothetical protein